MASNVSNLLKEKIVTPVANSVAAQVDNKVKNGIILRKFIGVQLGESNTGCQLVKIDLNKINVKDPSYEFTLYIKAFSQKGLFNFIINVNKTDSLQVDVKCEVKNSDSNNGEAIGYYDVDAVGNTITISLLKAFVVNTSINECKFVSTKDILNISDLDIDWSDTGNVKNDTSIDIKGKESTIEIDVDKYLRIDTSTLVENQRYRIATIDYSKLSEAKYFDGTSWSPTIGKSIGCFVRIKIASDLMGMMILEIRPFLMSMFDLRSASVILESKGKLTFSIDSDRGNIDAFLYKSENKSIQIFYNNDLFSTTSKDTIHVFSCEIISLNAKLDPDTIKVTFDMDTTIVTDRLYGIALENNMNLYKVFTTDVNSIGGPSFNGLVPGPNKNEAENKYLLGADAKWHPRKAGNEYIANLKPTEEIKGLSETDTTKGISFVTFDFNTLSQKVVEAAPSTMQEFMIDMKVLTHDLGIITISTNLTVTTAGLVPCNGVLSDRGMGSNTDRFSTIYSGKLGAVVSPGFFVNDMNTKIFKIALYTPIAINGVKIIDAVVTSYSDIIDEGDITFTWELGILEKKPPQLLRSDIIYPRIDLDRELVFDQMDIETPISETDEDTLFAEQIKHNGLVPAPGKYEVNNGYYLKADGTWDLPKRGNNNSVSVVTPSEEMTSQVSSTVGITFVTFDYSKIIESLSLAVNTGSGFEGILIINTKLFGEILINFSVSLFNLNGTINKGATAYANVGTKSIDHHSQISLIQNTYGADIKTPVFIYNDSVNNICKIGLYSTASKSPVIIKDCTLNQTYTDFDVNDITITWEPTTITISEENTNDASLFTNMDWSKIFTPIANMTDPDGSYSENNLRRWKLQNNGLVPAPAKYEADQGHVLCADGTWKKMESGSNFTAVPITLDPTKYQEAYETQTNPDTSKKTIMFMNLDISSIVATGTNITKIELSMYSPIYGTSRLVIDTMINSIKNQYCVNEDANGAGFYMDYCLAVAEVENSGFTGKDDTKIESFYTFVIDGDIIKIGISPIIFKLLNGTTPPYPIVTLEDCKVFIQSITDGSTSTDISEIPISYEQSTYTLNSVYGANHNGWIAKNTIFSAYVNYDTRDFQSLHNGLVPAPTKVEVEEGKFLKADGTWAIPPSTRGNDNYITKVERDPSTVDQVSATKATSFLTIDYSTICEQLGAATGDAGQADSNIFTSLEVMAPVWGKIQISIVSFLSDNWFSVLVYSDAGTGWYTDNIAYKIHSDISDNELHTRPGFYTMDDVNKTITLGMYGSYGADEIAIIDCTSIAVGEGFSVDDMIYNYDRQLIDIPESAKDFDEIGITRNTVFQSMAYADTDPDGTKYLYQRGYYNGLVPAPAKYDVTHNYMLRPNGTWGPIEGIIRNRTFTVTPHTNSSSTQTNDYVITEGAEDLAIAINENYSVDINIVFSGLGSKNNTNTTLIITGVTGTVNLYDYSGNPIKYITDGMSMKCTIFKNTIDDPVESMNAYCIYDIISYPDTLNGPSE